MSSPPISDTKRTSVWSFSTHAATATTSWIILAPASGPSRPAPEPVKKMRSRGGGGGGGGSGGAPPPRHDLRLVFHASEKLEHLLGLAGVVALVVLPDDLGSARLAFGCSSPIHDHRFDRGRADVHPDELHHLAFWATCSTRLAAWPAQPRWGTR